MKFLAAACFFALAAIGRADFQAPVPVRTVAPEFPVELRQKGVSGVVTLNCLIDTSGVVRETTVEKASDAGFVQPAIDAMKKWKFKPAQRDGTAVAVRVSIPLKFLINED